MPVTLSGPVTVKAAEQGGKVETVGVIIITPTAKQVLAGEVPRVIVKQVITNDAGDIVDEGEGEVTLAEAQTIDAAKYAAIATNLKPFTYLAAIRAKIKFNKLGAAPTGGTVT